MEASEHAGVGWVAELPRLRIVRSHAFGSSGRRLAKRLTADRELVAAVPEEERPKLLDACRRAASGGATSLHHRVRVGADQIRCCTTVRRLRGGEAGSLVGMTRVLAEEEAGTAWDLVPGLALDVDAELRVRAWSGALQVPGAPDELRGQSLAELLPPRDRSWSELRERLARGEPVRWEAAFGERVLVVRASPRSNGRFGGAAVLVVDATGWFQNDESLRASVERLRTLLEASPDPIFLKDGEGHWLEANDAALDLFGLRGVDFLGKTDLELAEHTRFYADALRFCCVTDEEAWSAEGQWRGEEQVPQPDGSVRVYDVIKVPLFNSDGTRRSFVVIGREITDRRRLEEQRDRLLRLESAARASAERGRARSEFLAGASKRLGQSLDYASTVRAAAELAVPFLAARATVDMLEARVLARMAVAAVDEPSKEDAAGPPPNHPAMLEVARSGKPQFWTTDGGVGQWRPCGGDLVTRQALSVGMEARGRNMGVLTVGSAHHELELGPDDILLVEDLGRRAALAIDNARLYRDATEAIRSREEFLAVASHELRTPLTTMQLGVQRLLQYARSGRLVDIPPATVLRLLESADRQRHRLGKLVDQLLTGARIGEGRLELPLERIDLEEVVRGVLDGMSEELARSSSRLDLQTTSVLGRWEPFRLEQIATSLVSNAIKYGEGRPISVEVLEQEPGVAVLRVSDKGIGIEAERLPRIFERFERATSWRHYGGLGLGLFVARKLAAELGGTIEARSELGKGSTFEVRLPMAGPVEG